VEVDGTLAAPPRHAPRLLIEHVTPAIDGGRYPVKRIVGDSCVVEADILRDGHDQLAGRIAFRGPGDQIWSYAPLVYDYDSDRWSGTFVPTRIGRWTYSVEAWTDRFATWRHALLVRRQAGKDVATDLAAGAALFEEAAAQAVGSDRATLVRVAASVGDPRLDPTERAGLALHDDLVELVSAHLPRLDLTRHAADLPVIVDRERARFAAWYEMFPRSQGTEPGRAVTLAEAARRLPAIAALGFDVVYLPPIHPIGVTHRKGPNNASVAGPDDPGSPWAIGSAAGGHTAVEPALGTLADFDRFVHAATDVGMEVALDYAPHCSPDHPWVREHPNWFLHHPDGSLRCAENPPYTFEDIVPFDFWCADREALWTALRDVLFFWIARGVRSFRVDNPHTKPFAFWEWAIDSVKAAHPDVLFLAESFTRPKPMRALAALGFSQSYTYFIWRTTAAELRDYFTELTRGELADIMRGALFPTTPDVLHSYLQSGGRAAFRVRLVLAATLSPLYGVYSGYELCEADALHADGEEYRDSEKFQIRVRDWNAPGNLNADLALLNRLRRMHPALQRADNLRFSESENAAILWYARHGLTPEETLLVAVTLDPHQAQETMVHVPVALWRRDETTPFAVEDVLSGERYTWCGARNYVRLDPSERVAQIFRLLPPGSPA
jgi:starch synthase (maltosyl-transferring)